MLFEKQDVLIGADLCNAPVYCVEILPSGRVPLTMAV